MLPDLTIKPHVKRGHRPRMGKELRVILPGASVDVSTHAQLKRWMGSKLSRGVVLDQLTTHGKRTKFKPKKS